MISSLLLLGSMLSPGVFATQERAPSWPIHRRLRELGKLGHVVCVNSGKGCFVLGFATSGVRGLQNEALLSASKELNATFAKFGLTEDRNGVGYRFLEIGGQLVIAKVQEGGKGDPGTHLTGEAAETALRQQVLSPGGPNTRRWVMVGKTVFCLGRGGSCYTGGALAVARPNTPWFDEKCAKATKQVNAILANASRSTPKGSMLSIIGIGGIPMLVHHQMGGEPTKITPEMVTDDSDPVTLYKAFRPTYLPKLPMSDMHGGNK